MTKKSYRIVPDLAQTLAAIDGDSRLLLAQAVRVRQAIERPFIVAHIEGDEGLPILLDGRIRDGIVDDLLAEGIEVAVPEPIVEPSVKTIEQAKRWIGINQLAQKQLTDAQKVALLLTNAAYMDELRDAAAKRQAAGKKVGANPTQGESEADQKGRTIEKVAKGAAVSSTTAKAVAKVLKTPPDTLKGLLLNKKVKNFPGSDKTKELLANGETLDGLMLRPTDEPGHLSIDKANKIANWCQANFYDQARSAEREARYAAYEHVEGEYENRIIAGESSEVLAKIEEPFIDFTFTSPPYLLPSEMIGYDRYEYVDVVTWKREFRAVMEQVFRLTVHGGRCAINIDATSDRQLGESTKYPVAFWVQEIMYAIGWEFQDEVCWAKQNAVGNRFSVGTFGSPEKPNVNRNHEYVLVFYKGSPRKPWRHEGKPFPDISREEALLATISTWNVDYSKGKEVKVPTFWYVNPAEGRVDGPCPVPFPLKLADLAIALWSWAEDLVFDPYSGNGTTCIAAKRRGRRFLGIDLSEDYCRFAQNALRNDSGDDVHEGVAVP